MNKNNDSDKNMKFWIDMKHFNKIIKYAESSYRQFKAEIGGQMICIEDKEGNFILKDPVILEQDVSAADCTMKTEPLALHYSKMASKHGKNVRHCWWHSHHTMKAFWSGQDDSTILDTPAKDWTVSLVVNLKREYKLRIQFFKPFLHEENIELNFLQEDVKNDKVIDEEVKKLCTAATHAQVNTYYNGTYSGPNNYAMSQYYQGQLDDQMSFNQSFGILDNNMNPKVNFNGISQKTQRQISDFVENLTDSIDPAFGFKVTKKCLKKYNKAATNFNIKIKDLGLKIKLFKNVPDLNFAISTFWPEQYVENIKVNKKNKGYRHATIQ